MFKHLLSLLLIFSVFYTTQAQQCPGDVSILEDEGLEVWEVLVDGNTVLSLSAFQGTVNVGGTDYTQPPEDGGWGLIVSAHDIATGSFIWAQQIVGPGFFVTNPTLMSNGTLAVVGTTEGSAANGQFLRLESFDITNGTPGWNKSYNVPVTGSNLPFGAQVMPYDGTVSGNGDFILTGAFAGTMDLTISTLTSNGNLSESFAFALDPSGNELWAVQSTGSNGRARSWTIEAGTGTVAIGGHFTGTVNFGGVSFSATDNTIINPYIAQLNTADGSTNWVVGFENGTTNGFNNIYDLAIDPDDVIYYTGNFNYSIDILGNTVTSQGGTDILLGGINSNGTFFWASQLGGPSTSDEFAPSLMLNAGGTLFVSTQLATDSVYFNNSFMAAPPTFGHYFFGLDAGGTIIEPVPANSLSKENSFGYSAFYDLSRDIIVMGNIIQGDGQNIKIASWLERPLPHIDIQLQDGTLDPDETLTTFDPGDGSYTYQWLQDGLAVGTNINSYTASVNAQYSVDITSLNGCTVSSDPVYLLDGSTLESDSLVLVELFNNTDGANWSNNANWLIGDVSTWDGITVNGGRVTQIFRANNNLNGNFPQSIGSLTQLEQLYLDTNNLTGSIPASFWDITSMIHINLHDNPALTWSIEPGIQNMISLTGIRAFNTNLTGNIPAEIGGATSLIELDLATNQLNGSIPTEIGLLTSLDFLSLGNNQMTGSIPAEFASMASLTNVILHGNQFNGSIPVEIGSMPNLQYFDVNNNQLTGIVPATIGNLNLVSLNLENNQLSGTFPDEIWQIGSLEDLNIGFNAALEVVLPSNLASLTQLTNLRIGGTVPIGGAFPTDLYSLTNLLGLDLGGHNFTGTLNANIGNWSNLDNIYLWGNKLEGDFPTEITNATNLRAMSLAGNQFSSFPDISSLGNVEDLELQFNFLGFKDIIPNLTVPTVNFIFEPQNRRPGSYLTVDEGGSLDLINDYTEGNNVYTWVRNQTDTVSNSLDYSIATATLDDLGGYFCFVTNPAIPTLTIQTQFYNVAFTGAPRSWTVDNSPGSIADFKSLYAGTYGTNDGDTLYVAGSSVPYNVGFNLFESPRVIYGPGYFLTENPETQASPLTAQVGAMGFKIGSQGSVVYGLDVTQLLLNNQGSAINDTLRNIDIIGNRVSDFSFNDDCQNISVRNNFINIFTLASTTAIGTSRSYQDLTISNNIIDTVTTFFAKATAARNEMVNVVFNRNTINVFTDSIQDATVTDNIINNYQATANAENGTIGYAGANFANTSGMLAIDNDFVSTTNVNSGAFSGADPYVLSGIAPIPHIYTLNNTGRIRLFTEAKNEASADITTMRYRLGEGGTIVQKGQVTRLEAGNQTALTFRPKLGNVTPGASVNLMVWVQDANGLKSVPQALSFVAETTTATGNIFTADNQPVTKGKVLLFEINQEGAAFDTLSTSLNNQGGFTFNNIVIGDYLALSEANNTDFPGHLPTYYEQIDLWEEADTLLIDTDNPVFDITLLAEPKETTGNGMVSGYVEEELGDDAGTGGRVEARGRVKRAGVSMRRGSRTNRPGEEQEFELIDFVFTNDNGEFVFENLPADEYRINIQYPGFPMDTLSSIDLNVRENADNAFELEALVDEGKITVTILSTTGLLDEIIEQVRVYPNPTTTEGINIRFSDDSNLKGSLDLHLFDVQGNLIINKTFEEESVRTNEINLPLDGLKQGTYLLRMNQSQGEIGTIRLVIR